MTLGDKLSKLRKENNYTQEQLADVLGVSRQSISKWESNITYPECDTVLNHTGLYEYRHGKMLMHLRFIFESLSELNSPGEYMRYYRQLRGLTTRQLAEKLNIVNKNIPTGMAENCFSGGNVCFLGEISFMVIFQ